MNLVRLRPFLFVVLLTIAFSCEKEAPTPPYVINNSVKPGDFLTNDKYDVLNVEVAYVEGYQPTAIALDHLLTFLKERLNKTGGITITQRTMPATGRLSMDIDFVRETEKGQRKLVTSGSVLTAWIMFVDSEYSESTQTQKVLGITYGASSIVVFGKSVDALVQPGMAARRTIESLVLEHEMGHVFGLVNNGIPMIAPHQDTSHGNHCSNPECLMYWQSENNVDLNDLLGDDNLPVFDANCLSDLRAAGGK